MRLQFRIEHSEFWRSLYDESRERRELPEDFWDQLVVIGGEYVRALDDWLATAQTGPWDEEKRARLGELRLKQCRTLHDALSEAKETFGEEKLLRFLYGAVAPRMFVAPTTPPDARELRWEEGGCR